jgi:hypothetical protein
MDFTALSAMGAYYFPEGFLCPMIVFATFVAARNAQIVTVVTYVPAQFEYFVHQAFTSFRIYFYY